MSGSPALAEGRLLAFESQLLSAFDAVTGAAQWHNTEAEALVRAPVVAAGYAYASSDRATYAFDPVAALPTIAPPCKYCDRVKARDVRRRTVTAASCGVEVEQAA